MGMMLSTGCNNNNDENWGANKVDKKRLKTIENLSDLKSRR